MHEIFPLSDVQTKFTQSLNVEQLGISEYAKLKSERPGTLFNIGANVWGRTVYFYRPDIDLHAMRIETLDDPTVIDTMESIIGAKVIKNITFTECTVDGVAPELGVVARLSLAHVYRNDLHLADVFFRNPFKPIPPQLQKHGRRYEGLGLLDTVMNRLEDYAKKQSVEFITLTAADDSLVKKFGEYGFRIQNSPYGSEYRLMEKPITPPLSI